MRARRLLVLARKRRGEPGNDHRAGERATSRPEATIPRTAQWFPRLITDSAVHPAERLEPRGRQRRTRLVKVRYKSLLRYSGKSLLLRPAGSVFPRPLPPAWTLFEASLVRSLTDKQKRAVRLANMSGGNYTVVTELYYVLHQVRDFRTDLHDYPFRPIFERTAIPDRR